MDDVLDNISANTPAEFEDGLAGIGWGIAYLVNEKFIDADANDGINRF